MLLFSKHELPTDLWWAGLGTLLGAFFVLAVGPAPALVAQEKSDRADSAAASADSGNRVDGESAESPKKEFVFAGLDQRQKEILVDVFAATHEGYSVDEVILDDALQAAFLKACSGALPNVAAGDLNWTLMNLRKAGKLSEIATTRRRAGNSTAFLPLAEIAARQLFDRYGVSSDQIMCLPELREEFNGAALQVDPDADLYLARKAALQLRKTRRLRPELITRIADWGRVVTVRPASEFRSDPEQIPETSGIYIISDASGYLYVGESDNLRRRLGEHLDESDRRSLANYLASAGCENVTLEIHTFAEGSRIDELAVRRAYESELIRSRNPRFNIRP